jgi:hypothetical protein
MPVAVAPALSVGAALMNWEKARDHERQPQEVQQNME